jgi:hypothetical protein
LRGRRNRQQRGDEREKGERDDGADREHGAAIDPTARSATSNW